MKFAGKLQLAASDSDRCNSSSAPFSNEAAAILFFLFLSLSLSLALAHLLWAMNGYEICTIEDVILALQVNINPTFGLL